MRVMNIDKCNLLNGEGCRIILWVSHCEHSCPFCHNGYSWNENLGELFNENHMKEIYEELSKPYISGITFSGGDPLSYKNYKDIIELSKQLRKDFPNKTQWLWTGYTYEELMSLITSHPYTKRDEIKLAISSLVGINPDLSISM